VTGDTYHPHALRYAPNKQKWHTEGKPYILLLYIAFYYSYYIIIIILLSFTYSLLFIFSNLVYIRHSKRTSSYW